MPITDDDLKMAIKYSDSDLAAMLAAELLEARGKLAAVRDMMLRLKGYGPAQPLHIIEVPDAVLTIIDERG